jgi:Right handed beta helix region/FlgD Ig-like domain
MLSTIAPQRRPAAAIVAAILAAYAFLPASARADFLRVPDDYPTISLALGVAQPADVIGVRGGTYRDTFALRNGIAILGGFDPAFSERDPLLYETVLRALDDGRIVTANSVGSGAVLDGFVLTGGRGQDGGLALLQDASPTISHCRFVDAVGGRGGSLYLIGSAAFLFENEFTGSSSSEVGGALAIFSSQGTLVRGCRFEDNTALSSGGAVFTDNSSPRFVSCTFIDNQTSFHGGSILIQSSGAVIDSCVIARSTGERGGGIGVFANGFTNLMSRLTIVANSGARGGGLFVNAGEVIIDRTIVAQNTGNGLEAEPGGIVVDACNDVWLNQPENYVMVIPGSTSFSLDPLFCEPEQDNWELAVDSPCASPNSPFCGRIGALPVGCGGAFIRVPDDHPSIVSAINAAGATDTVAVAEGVYLEHITLKPEIVLLGGWRSDFAERDPLLYPTVIDARGLLSAVVAQSGEGRDTVIDGFVIRNGDRPGGAGGGIYCFNASPTISNNVFHGNKAEQGGAIGCLAGAAPAITGNVIYDNLATGSPGGAIYVQANAEIIGNTLDQNQGTPAAGIAARFNARPIVSRNIIVNGREGFGLFADKGAVPITSCNDVWMNALGDYFGVLPGPNSLSADPRFCPGENRFLAGDSPCAPDNAPAACGRIGARDVACPVAAVEGEAESGSVTKSVRSWLGAPVPHPIPFAAPGTVIGYGLAEPGEVELAIYDAVGRCVRQLVIGSRVEGDHRAFWDGRDARGAQVAPGVYFYRLAAGGREIGHRKLVIVR